MKMRLILMLGAMALLAAGQAGGMTIPHINPAALPVIDGDIAEWEALFSAPLLTQVNFLDGFSGLPMNESDQKVEAWLGWNKATNLIYAAGRVTDDFYGTNTFPGDPSMVWRSDDMQVYIDADNSGGAYDAFNLQAQQYVMNPETLFEGVLFPPSLPNPPEVQAKAQRSGTIYTYEFAIPGWDSFDTATLTGVRHIFQPNEVIGIEIAFSDFEDAASADAAAYHAFNSLNGAWGGYWNADVFTDFTLGAPTGCPIPEPSTVLLLGTGLVGLVGYGWHRRKA